jgi:hypothetical protein
MRLRDPVRYPARPPEQRAVPNAFDQVFGKANLLAEHDANIGPADVEFLCRLREKLVKRKICDLTAIDRLIDRSELLFCRKGKTCGGCEAETRTLVRRGGIWPAGKRAGP